METHYDPDSPGHDTHIHHADFDDAMSEYSSSGESVQKPLQPFDTLLENGLPLRPRRRTWWEMVVRSRRRCEMEGLKEDATEGLLALPDVYTKRRTARRLRGLYNYCIFGGISGLSIMYEILPKFLEIY